MRTPNLKLSSSKHVGPDRAAILYKRRGNNGMTNQANLGGSFTLPGTSMNLNRMGYGAMQLAGPHVWGPPRDIDAAIAVLREAVAFGVNHIDTSDYFGPHVTNQLLKSALHPYDQVLV